MFYLVCKNFICFQKENNNNDNRKSKSFVHLIQILIFKQDKKLLWNIENKSAHIKISVWSMFLTQILQFLINLHQTRCVCTFRARVKLLSTLKIS